MNIIAENRQTDLKIDPNQITPLAQAVIAYEGFHTDEVAIHIVSNEEMCELHNDYFDDPSPTDCISFPMDNDDPSGFNTLGDVFVCPKIAIEYATEHKIDPYEELTLYIVHGLLHLMGYDDIEDEDREEMRAAEKKHMDHLKTLDLCLSL